MLPLCLQIRLDVAQALATTQLTESQRYKLRPAAGFTQPLALVVGGSNFLKFMSAHHF